MGIYVGFPAPPENKKEWPWHAVNVAQQGSVSLPRISVITPSFNHGQFIEETIRSVLLQSYPNLEYIIIDGGSTDQTIDVIKEYEPWLAYWVSEPDHGQSHAINKGLEKATGEWVAWLNADDAYLPGALYNVATAALKNNQFVSWIVGTTIVTDSKLRETGQFVPSLYTASGRDRKYRPSGWTDFVCTKRSGIALPQQSSFWLRSAVVKAGGVDESLHYAMDHELYGRLAYHGYRPVLLEEALACFRLHEEQKTTRFPVTFWREELTVVYNWMKLTNGTEQQTLEKYSNWLNQQIKNYPFRSLSQSIISMLSRIAKVIFPSSYNKLRQQLKKPH
jgi:glycosyltransferase involved in cell wall biosynthesis